MIYLNSFYKDDIVYLKEKVTYNGKSFNRGKPFIVLKQEIDVVECLEEGKNEVYKFSSDFLVNKLEKVPFTKDFYLRILEILLGIATFFIIIFLVVGIKSGFQYVF